RARAAKPDAPGLDPVSFLKRRHDMPDLFIVGALSANPALDWPEKTSDAPRQNPRSFRDVRKRASNLRKNVKVRSVVRSGERTHELVGRLLHAPNVKSVAAHRSTSIVSAAVHPIFPPNEDHPTPTFGFVPMLGLEIPRLQLSIANGCFTTIA